MKTEYTCERCGIRVLCAIPQPDETLYCLACRFIECIDDPEERRQVAEALDKHNPMFDREEGGQADK